MPDRACTRSASASTQTSEWVLNRRCPHTSSPARDGSLHQRLPSSARLHDKGGARLHGCAHGKWVAARRVRGCAVALATRRAARAAAARAAAQAQHGGRGSAAQAPRRVHRLLLVGLPLVGLLRAPRRVAAGGAAALCVVRPSRRGALRAARTASAAALREGRAGAACRLRSEGVLAGAPASPSPRGSAPGRRTGRPSGPTRSAAAPAAQTRAAARGERAVSTGGAVALHSALRS